MTEGKALPWLGVLGISFYGLHAGHQLIDGHPENLLWTCHLGALAVGFGLLLRWRVCVAVGVLWLTIGIPLWLVDLAHGGEFIFTSPFTHVGGMVLGIVALRVWGIPRHVWWKAGFALVPLFFLTRWVTPRRDNVNLAFSIWPGSEKYFPTHSLYVVAVFLLCLGVFLCAEICLRRLGLRSTDDSNDRAEASRC